MITFLPFCNNHISQNYYQDNFRFYIDEFPEQEKLRNEWFENNKYFLYKNRFGQNSIIFGCDISKLIDGLKRISQLGIEFINKPDKYFENRWLKRQ
jgi:hypothetical protein